MHHSLKPFYLHEQKEQVIDDPVMRIGGLKFGIFSEPEIQHQAHIEVTDKNLYDQNPADRRPQPNGPLDPRLGTIKKDEKCPTCGLPQKECNGHWGYIKLHAPCFHIGFLSFTMEILGSVCKTCSRILLPEQLRRQHLRAIRRPGLDPQQRKSLLKRIQSECRKSHVCPHCGASNGPIRKVPGHACKIMHLKFEHYNKSTAKSKVAPQDKKTFDKTFNVYLRENPDMDKYVRKAVDDLLPIKVYNIFHHILAEDCELLGIDLTRGRPESYLWTYVPVPPTGLRPTVPGETSSTEDDLTVKLQEIVDLNTRFKAAFDGEEHISLWMDLYEKLQDHLAMYVNSQAPGLNKLDYGKPIRSFCTRLKGKQGRFRGNLSGKRVNYSGRTVIGPDPNLSIEEVGMPVHVAKILSYPERVTEHNLAELRQMVKNGSSKYPGANQVRNSSGMTTVLKFVELRPERHAVVVRNLKVGDIVDRHIINGDIVLFNRQPSLHKLSVLCHRVRVHQGRTFRMNESVCNPYNADFDGDEMNIHVPQTEEARTEAIELMGVKHNLITPKNGAPIIAPIQDFITAAYLLSQKDRFFTRSEFSQLMGYMFDAAAILDPAKGTYHGYELPPPAIVKPQYLWTGKQIFNVLMRPNKETNVMVNVEAACRQYKAASKEPKAPDLNEDDAYLVVRNSEVMCGVFDKSIIGDGKKCSIFYAMLRDYGEDYAVQGMNRLAKLSARWLGTQGFSIGIGDVYPSENLNREKQKLIAAAKAETDGYIRDLALKRLTRDPGCDLDKTLENKVSKVLSDVRGAAGQVCFDELSRHNAAVVMAKSGSKGSMINVSQMVAGVGQQMIGGKRVENGFQDRTLPHFAKGSRDADSKGFVANSFFSGLTPSEFIFHAMSGREGLVDTAVKTAETGYMSRRLIKSLEDSSIAYDNTVRASNGSIVQFTFGDDSLDPAELEGNKAPVDFNRTWVHALETTYDPDSTGLRPKGVLSVGREALEKETRRDSAIPKDDDYDAKQAFVHELQKYIEAKAERLEKLHTVHSTPMSLSHHRRRKSLPDEISLSLDDEDDLHNKMAPVDNILRISDSSLRTFVELCLKKYERSRVQPGHAVGAIAAQSIGEPGTQMTLKTFHFAGVAGMSITRGVPRIKEIINAAKKISTPVITCNLTEDYKHGSDRAREVKAMVEKTYLSDIAEYIEDQWGEHKGVIRIKINTERCKELKLECSTAKIRRAICKAKHVPIKEHNFVNESNSHLVIRPDELDAFDEDEAAAALNGLDTDAPQAVETKPGRKPAGIKNAAPPTRSRGRKKTNSYYVQVQQLCRDIGSVVAAGYPETSRAIIKKSETKLKRMVWRKQEDGTNALVSEPVMEYQLLVEGYGLRACMNTPGVDGTKTTTNNVMETLQVLGIEAARSVIISEMNVVMGSMDIDTHHISLLADTMTSHGEVNGITRFGMAKMKDSVLQLASFEKTPDHLFDAASKMKEDEIRGVSESIIMGQPVGLGTGMVRCVMPLGLTDADLHTKESLFHAAVFEDRVANGWENVSWDGIGKSVAAAA